MFGRDTKVSNCAVISKTTTKIASARNYYTPDNTAVVVKKGQPFPTFPRRNQADPTCTPHAAPDFLPPSPICRPPAVVVGGTGPSRFDLFRLGVVVDGGHGEYEIHRKVAE